MNQNINEKSAKKCFRRVRTSSIDSISVCSISDDVADTASVLSTASTDIRVVKPRRNQSPRSTQNSWSRSEASLIGNMEEVGLRQPGEFQVNGSVTRLGEILPFGYFIFWLFLIFI